MTLFKMGHKPWNTGKHITLSPKKVHFKKGHKPWNKGKHLSKEIKRKISKTNKGKFKGKNNPFYGKHHSKETKQRWFISRKGIRPWNKGKIGIYSKETIDKIRSAVVNNFKIGKYPKKNTSIELKIQKLLKQNKIKYIPEQPLENITRVDMFIKPNIVIYCDGDYWHNISERKLKDKKINRILKSKGYKVIRLWEHDINNNIDKCLNRIQEVL